MKDLFDELVFTDHFVFDRVDMVSSLLKANIKTNYEQVFTDPTVLLQVSVLCRHK